MPDDKEDKDSDKTPIEPMMARKRSSQSAMVAIGWKACPECGGNEQVNCDWCFDKETGRFDRRLSPDRYIAWIRAHPGGEKK